MKVKEKIFQLIETQKEEIITSTARLLTFSTVSSPEGKLDEVTQQEFQKAFIYLQELAKHLGFRFKSLDNEVAIIELPGNGSTTETIGVLLHLDVMPPGKLEWKYPPFGGVIAEGKIWGRGAQDDKGPIIATLYGLWAAKEAGDKTALQRNCRLIIATHEETGKWDDIRRYIELEGTPDFSIVPDAEFPVTVAEKGMVNFEFGFDAGTPVKAGNSTVALVSLTAGERANMVPDIAELTLERLQPEAFGFIHKCLNEFKQSDPSSEFHLEDKDEKINIKFLGKSAHGSRPYEGKNAGVIALKFLLQLQVAPQSFASFIEFIWRAGKDLWGEALGIKSEHYFVGKTTSSLGLLRLGNRGGTAVFNIRNTLGLSVAEAEEKIRRVLQQLKENTVIEVNLRRTSSGTEALFVDPEKFRHYIEPLQLAYEAVTGRKSAPKAIGGTTFAKAFSRAVSFGPVLPEEEPELAHQVNEHVTIEHQLRNTKIYALALAGLISNASL